jgi:hypothetical protein
MAQGRAPGPVCSLPLLPAVCSSQFDSRTTALSNSTTTLPAWAKTSGNLGCQDSQALSWSPSETTQRRRRAQPNQSNQCQSQSSPPRNLHTKSRKLALRTGKRALIDIDTMRLDLFLTTKMHLKYPRNRRSVRFVLDVFVNALG